MLVLGFTYPLRLLMLVIYLMDCCYVGLCWKKIRSHAWRWSFVGICLVSTRSQRSVNIILSVVVLCSLPPPNKEALLFCLFTRLLKTLSTYFEPIFWRSG